MKDLDNEQKEKITTTRNSLMKQSNKLGSK